MELVPNQSQSIELETVNLHPSSADSSLAGVIPLVGGTFTGKTGNTTLFPLDESPLTGRAIRRPSQVSVRPSSIINFPYRQPLSVVPLPSPTDSESGKSFPGTPKHEEVRRLPADVRSKREAWRARVYYASQCFSLFLGGWNDAATGPLIPVFQTYYNINFTVVSLLFIASTVGFVLAGLILNIPAVERLAFGKVMLISSLFQIVGYSAQVFAPPFPIMAIAYGMNGFGWCVQNAKATGYICSVPKYSAKLGFLYACYGIGSLTVPIVSAQFAQSERWSFHYLTALGLAIFNTIFIATIFRLRDEETLHKLSGDASFPPEADANDAKKFKRMMGLKEIHIFAMWTFLYVGIEVTVGGWTNTFLIDYRGGTVKTAGYAVTAFWAGFTVGRVAFLWINRKIGERRAIHIYLAISMGLELAIWLIPSFTANLVSVCAIGLFLGPMYPIMMHQTSHLLPRTLLHGAIAWISSMGVTGSAILPFITGALASKFGIISLQPFILSMMALMGGCWMLVPTSSHQRVE